MKPTRVAIYARVSKEEGQEVENQLAQMRDFCQRSTWHIVREYVDHETGSRADRQSFLELFREAPRRKFDVVFFWALDRFSREGTLPTLKYLESLTAYGVGFRSYTEPFLDSCGPFSDAIIGFIAAIAKQERLRISDRTLAALALRRRQLQERGFFVSKKSGKRCTALGRPPTADSSSVASLRAQGRSWRQVANELGITPSSAQRAFQRAARTLPETADIR